LWCKILGNFENLIKQNIIYCSGISQVKTLVCQEEKGEKAEKPDTLYLSGNVEKSRQPSPRLRQAGQRRSLPRRSGFAKAGRPFAVLTYYEYAPRVKRAAAFPSTPLRTGLNGPFGKTQGMLF